MTHKDHRHKEDYRRERNAALGMGGCPFPEEGNEEEDTNKTWMEWKNEYARREREQERQAYLNDMEMERRLVEEQEP